MGLLGDGFDDPRSGAVMALAGGLLKGDFGGGLLGANDAFRQAKADALKTQLVNMQMQDMQQQAELRRQQAAQLARKQSLIESMFGGAGQFPSQPAAPGQLGSGSFGVMPPAAGLPPILQAAPSAGVAGMTPDKLALLKAGADIDLTDIYKLTQPDMQVSNGYAYDKRTVRPGFLPQMNVSQDGKASLTQIGPDGLPVVSAPRGAYDTYAGFRNIDESAKANFDPLTVTPQGESPQMTTRGSLVRNPLVSGRITPQQQAALDSDRGAILQAELTKAQQQLNDAIGRGDQSAAARAQADIAALNREMGGRRPTVGLPLQSEEEKLRASQGVQADAKRNEALTADAQKSKDTLANITMARALLKRGPTSSGIGSVVDSGANLFGMSTKGADLAAQLDTLSGWMVNNVPRMEGPQSNYDVQNYKTMAALVGDRTKPLSQRLAALDTLEGLQQKYAALNKGGNAINATPGQEPAKPNVLNELPKTAPKGQRVRDTQTGKVLQFNGITWVEVK